MAFTPDGNRAWVTLNGDGAAGGDHVVLGLTAMRGRSDGVVEVLDTTGRTVTRSIARSIALADYPEGLALSPDGRTLYVTSNAVNGVLTVVRLG